MSWNPIADMVAGLNQLGSLVSDLVIQFTDLLLNVVTLIMYPVYVMFTVFVYDVNMIYGAFATLVNLLISISAIPSTILGTIFQLPNPWVVLLMLSLSISLSVRVYKYIKEVYNWFWGS